MPLMECGFEAYLFSPKYVLNTVQRLQNTALRICCGAMASTPLCALQQSCGELPVHIRHIQACLNYRYSILSCETHPCCSLTQDSWHEIFPDSNRFVTFNMLTRSNLPSNINMAEVGRSPAPPWMEIPFNLDDTLREVTIFQSNANFIKQECQHHIEEQNKNALRIYTDGSKNCNGCGAGYYVPEEHYSNNCR